MAHGAALSARLLMVMTSFNVLGWGRKTTWQVVSHYLKEMHAMHVANGKVIPRPTHTHRGMLSVLGHHNSKKAEQHWPVDTYYVCIASLNTYFITCCTKLPSCSSIGRNHLAVLAASDAGYDAEADSPHQLVPEPKNKWCHATW